MRWYRLLTVLLLPLLLLRVLIKGVRQPEYRRHLRQRLGLVKAIDTPCLWIHAVSVGEVNAAAVVVKALRERDFGGNILITTTTPTGKSRVESLFGDSVHHRYLPFDIHWSMARFIQSMRPQVVLVMETEIWPNMVTMLKQSHVPVVWVNARMSQKSYVGYRRFGRFAQSVFSQLDLCLVQYQSDADRIVDLGVSADRLHVTGSIKFDQVCDAGVVEEAKLLRTYWGKQRDVWVAGSTRKGEEQKLLQAFLTLRGQSGVSEVLLVLVPRHPERVSEILALIDQARLSYVRHSQLADYSCADPLGSSVDIYIVDVIGFLTTCYAASDVAFVGGSLVPLGGQNILEPCAYGVPVVFGPYMDNFKEIARQVVTADAGIQVQDEMQLAQVIEDLLQHASKRRGYSERGFNVINANKGALANSMSMLEPMLKHVR